MLTIDLTSTVTIGPFELLRHNVQNSSSSRSTPAASAKLIFVCLPALPVLQVHVWFPYDPDGGRQRSQGEITDQLLQMHTADGLLHVSPQAAQSAIRRLQLMPKSRVMCVLAETHAHLALHAVALLLHRP
jgi:hypothetical protein